MLVEDACATVLSIQLGIMSSVNVWLRLLTSCNEVLFYYMLHDRFNFFCLPFELIFIYWHKNQINQMYHLNLRIAFLRYNPWGIMYLHSPKSHLTSTKGFRLVKALAYKYTIYHTKSVTFTSIQVQNGCLSTLFFQHMKNGDIFKVLCYHMLSL